MKIEGAGGGGFLVNWLCSVIFVFEGAGEMDFSLIGCVLLFLFLKVLPEVDFLLIVYAMSFLLFFMLFRWWRRCGCNRARSSRGEILNEQNFTQRC